MSLYFPILQTFIWLTFPNVTSVGLKDVFRTDFCELVDLLGGGGSGQPMAWLCREGKGGGATEINQDAEVGVVWYGAPAWKSQQVAASVFKSLDFQNFRTGGGVARPRCGVASSTLWLLTSMPPAPARQKSKKIRKREVGITESTIFFERCRL